MALRRVQLLGLSSGLKSQFGKQGYGRVHRAQLVGMAPGNEATAEWTLWMSKNYGLAVAASCLTSVGLFGTWQLLNPHVSRQHLALSWDNLFVRGHWWTLWTSHYSHRDLEHLISNVVLCGTSTWVLQSILPFRLLIGGFFFGVPLVTSVISMAGLYYFYGPEEAKELKTKYPGLTWDRFCYMRWLELRNGLKSPCTPHYCGFDALGIPEETTVPRSGYDMCTIMDLYGTYDLWMNESMRCKIGMSGIVQSFAGFAAAWLLHLARFSPHSSCIWLCFCGAVAPVSVDIAHFLSTEYPIKVRSEDPKPEMDCVRRDVFGHLSGFITGALLYIARSRGLTTPVQFPFALH